MIVFTRDLARRFRAVARKCVREWRRRSPPVVTAVVRGGTLTLFADLGDAGVSVSVPARGRPDAAVAFPMSVLDAAAGTGTDRVEVAATREGGAATWADRGAARSHPFAPMEPPTERHTSPPLSEVPAAFPAALHECGRTTGGDHSRFPTHAVRVRGASGAVIGTDGKQALVWGGFRLPFDADLLVPAVPVFGSRDLATAGDVRVWLTESHLVVVAGLWEAGLARLPPGRHPDVEGVVPRYAPATVVLCDADAAAVSVALPASPGADAAGRPVTLDVTDRLVVRAAGGGKVVEWTAAAATVEGVGVRVAVNRAHLSRALTLGCQTVRLVGPGKPLAVAGDDRVYLAAPLGPEEVVAPALDAESRSPGTPAPRAPDPIPHPEPRRRTLMRPSDTNGHPPGDRHDPPQSDSPDRLAEAEALRAALAEAMTRAVRLVAVLKRARKEQKALSAVRSSLRGLNLGAGGVT